MIGMKEGWEFQVEGVFLVGKDDGQPLGSNWLGLVWVPRDIRSRLQDHFHKE